MDGQRENLSWLQNSLRRQQTPAAMLLGCALFFLRSEREYPYSDTGTNEGAQTGGFLGALLFETYSQVPSKSLLQGQPKFSFEVNEMAYTDTDAADLIADAVGTAF